MTTLDRIRWLASRHYIAQAHVGPAQLLVDLNEAASEEGYVTGGETGRSAHGLLMQERITRARRRLEETKEALGPDLTQVLELVVVRNRTLGEAAEEMQYHEKAMLPLLRAGLQVLAAYNSR